MKQKHPIMVVSRRTGLSPHVIRAWENRYGAVSPERTPGNHRLYSDDDIQRLLTLKRATETGRSIGQLASLSTKELLVLIAEDATIPDSEPLDEIVNPLEGESRFCVRESLEAVKRFDSRALWETLYRSSISLGQIAVIEDVIVPLMRSIGAQWAEGSLRVLHEHAASAVILTYLGDLLRSLKTSDSSPRAVAGTLQGELHEIGCLAAAVCASLQGWKVQYLGSNLPWEEMAGAAEIFHATLILVSVIMPPEKTGMQTQLRKLRDFLPPEISIIAGGVPVASLSEPPEIGNVEYITDIGSLCSRLSATRNG
jgi:methanogenic corrinoid protein MtbC1